jgi:hypothetical protein
VWVEDPSQPEGGRWQYDYAITNVEYTGEGGNVNSDAYTRMLPLGPCLLPITHACPSLQRLSFWLPPPPAVLAHLNLFALPLLPHTLPQTHKTTVHTQLEFERLGISDQPLHEGSSQSAVLSCP